MHTLVAENFIGDTRGKEIHHKDYNPSNNCVENLEIKTRSEHHKIHNEKKDK